MTIENLEKELSQGKLNSLYLLYGEEEYLLETSVKKIKKLFGEILLGINYIALDETNVNSLIRGDRNTCIWIREEINNCEIKWAIQKRNKRKS